MQGSNIAILRKKIGIKQEELAQILEINTATLSRWENGHFEPNATAIKKICEVLHCTEAELLNGPSEGRVQITLSYDWQEIKKGDIDMDKNKFKLILGDDGQIGVQGSGLLTTREAMEQFFTDFRKELEIAFDTQVRRGIIPEA